MKTPMQLLLEKIENEEFLNHPKVICEFIKHNLLEKEKEVIMEAYHQGRKDSEDKVLVDELKYTSRDYYNENFL
jgi:hypothetical protein